MMNTSINMHRLDGWAALSALQLQDGDSNSIIILILVIMIVLVIIGTGAAIWLVLRRPARQHTRAALPSDEISFGDPPATSAPSSIPPTPVFPPPAPPQPVSMPPVSVPAAPASVAPASVAPVSMPPAPARPPLPQTAAILPPPDQTVAPAACPPPSAMPGTRTFFECIHAAVHFDLCAPRVCIGRAPDNDWVIDEHYPGWESVSRYHAMVQYEQGYWVLYDQGKNGSVSRNGIFVQGRRTQRNLLRDGWQVSIGLVELVFHEQVAGENAL